MSNARRPGMSTARRRRRRRTALTLSVLLLFLLGALGYAVAYYQGWLPQAQTAPASSSTPSPSTSAPPERPVPSEVRVNVYNATNRQGLAATTAERLRKRGFEVKDIANDPLERTVKGIAEIRHGDRGIPAAETMLAHLPDAELVHDDRRGAAVDLVLGRQFDRLGPVPPEQTEG